MRNQRLLMLFALPVLLLRVAFPASQAVGETSLERQTNERQPPGKVLPAIGVKPGMVIGEVGAGRGRYTVHLARGVGETGKIYANDINPQSLEYLRLRCENEGIRNVETVLGRVDDPLFPKGALDMAFMVLTYHHLAKPVELLKNLIPSLKPGAEIVIIDPDPVRDEDRGGRESTSEEKIRGDAARAGLELVRVETFLEKDNIFILALPRGGQERARPKEADPAGAPYDPQKKIPAAALREDLKILWDAMEEGHGGFDRYTPRRVLEKSFDDVMSGLTAPLTEFDFLVRLLPLVAEIKDGHTRVQPSAAAGAYLDDQAVFPFELRFLDGRTYLFRNLSGDRGIREGTELLAVNGTAVDKIVAELLALIPNDAGITTRKLRQLEFPANFGRLFALRFGRPDSFRIRFRPYQNSDVHEVTVPGIRARDAVRILHERYPAAAKRPPLYDLSFRGPAAVLTIRSFADDPEKGSPPYPEFLKNAFRALEEKKTPTLVIDLRDNGGGADEYGKLLFAYVMDRPFLYYRALETRKDRYDLYRYTTISPKEAGELAKQVKKNARGWFDVLGHPNLGLQQPRSPRFTGKVAILINGLSFSATGETTSLFHYYKKAVFFGEECGAGYYGNTSGFMVTVVLPNTRIQARIPLILYTMAVDGYPKDRGIVPDVPVSPTIEDLLAGRDPVMQRALMYLDEKESRGQLPPPAAYDLSQVASGKGWKVVNRGAEVLVDGGRKGVRFDERAGEGLAWLEGSRFGDGTIEFDVRGKDVLQKSFVGAAFHAVDAQTFEAVYFRPFNFKPEDPARAGRAVQYVSHPENTWQKLRAEKPGQYEKPAAPVPDPNGWFHVRITVVSPNISVFVDESPVPCLTVQTLSERREGLVGLMVGNGSGGDFANLKITPAKGGN